jgi:uridine kinase
MAYLIAIGGGSGSGKTFLAEALKNNLHLECSVLSYDNYYKDESSLTMEQRSLVNYDDPASLDEELFLKHLAMLHDGQAIEVPQYDFKTHTRTKQTVHFEPTPFIIVEGILVLNIPNPKAHYDFTIYVDAEADMRLARRLLRDEKERGRVSNDIVRQYLATVRPMHKKYIEPVKKNVDFVFTNNDNDGLDERQMGRLLSKLRGLHN